jgi:hypothetical protein
MTAEQEKRCIETFNSTFDCIRNVTTMGTSQKLSQRINDNFLRYLKIYDIFLENISLTEELDKVLKKKKSLSNYKKYYSLFTTAMYNRLRGKKLYNVPLMIIKTLYYQRVSTAEEWIQYFAALNITHKPTIEKAEEFMNDSLKKESALTLYEILQPELIITAIKSKNQNMIDEYYNRLDDLLQKYHKYVLFIKEGDYFTQGKSWTNKQWFINRRYLGVFHSLYKMLKINNYMVGEVGKYKCSINNEIISDSEFFAYVDKFLKKNNIYNGRYIQEVWTNCFALGKLNYTHDYHKEPSRRFQTILDVAQEQINEITNQQKTDK